MGKYDTHFKNFETFGGTCKRYSELNNLNYSNFRVALFRHLNPKHDDTNVGQQIVNQDTFTVKENNPNYNRFGLVNQQIPKTFDQLMKLAFDLDIDSLYFAKHGYKNKSLIEKILNLINYR